ncbi:MAG: hypothetical protein HYY37_03705 [Candidatus Aenigmarchaeota archaeon]|nr:hypothetical protein [Candidatus Aenigmarchaeota archaeon]
MAFDTAFFLVLSLALGIKHAYDADHLVAVSNFLARSTGMRDTAKMTVSWALGHMITAAVITIILFTVAIQAKSLSGILEHFETAVAVMLILIGTVGILLEVPIVHRHVHHHIGRRVHAHRHSHRFGRLGTFARKAHLHPPLFGVGIIHGLASNDELLALFVAGLGTGSLGMLLAGLAVFTVGVMAGMMLFGTLITWPLLKGKTEQVRLAVTIIAGLMSIVYGFMMLAGQGG